MVTLHYKAHKNHNGRGAFYYTCPNSASELVELIISKGYSIEQIQVRYPNSFGSTSDRDIPVELVDAAEEKLGDEGVWSIKIANNDGMFLMRLNKAKQEVLLVTPVDTLQCVQSFTDTIGVGAIGAATPKKRLTIKREQSSAVAPQQQADAVAQQMPSQQPVTPQMPPVAAMPVPTQPGSFNSPTPFSRYNHENYPHQQQVGASPSQQTSPGVAAMFDALTEQEQRSVQSKHILLWVLAVVELFSAALPFGILAIRSLLRARKRNEQQLFTQCVAEISTARLAVGLGSVFWVIMVVAVGGMLAMFFL